MKKTILKKSLVCATALMLSAVSCSEVKGNVSVSESISDTAATIEPKEDIVITMAIDAFSEDAYKDAVDKFNEADNGYRIELIDTESDYDENGNIITYTPEEWKYKDLAILQKIMNTDEIDIICNGTFANESYYGILANKGAYADLYQFMENDPEVNKSTLNNHVLGVLENGGCLYTLPAYFQIKTLYGESKYVGTKENWTFDEFAEHWENMPDNATVNGSRYAENIYYTVLRGNLDTFIDYDNAEVHFDSLDYRKMLEFCGNFPSNNGEKTDYDYDVPRFVYEATINSMMQSLSLSNNEITYVGFPSENGDGAFFSAPGFMYSISAKSSPERQEGAWQFIRSFLTKEGQLENVIENYKSPELYGGQSVWSAEFGLCINNQAFDQMAEDIAAQKFRQPDEMYMTPDDELFEPVFPTVEDADKLRRYINTVNRWENRSDSSISQIIHEENSAYFAGGQDIDTTIEHIQNRASIWISEQA